MPANANTADADRRDVNQTTNWLGVTVELSRVGGVNIVRNFATSSRVTTTTDGCVHSFTPPTRLNSTVTPIGIPIPDPFSQSRDSGLGNF